MSAVDPEDGDDERRDPQHQQACNADTPELHECNYVEAFGHLHLKGHFKAISTLAIALVPGGLYAATMPPADTKTAGLFLDTVKYWPLARLPEFVAGMCVARLFLDNKIALKPRWADAVALAAGGAVLLAARFAPYPLLHTGLLALPFSALIWSMAGGEGLIARFLSLPTVVLLGEASYALYILHVPLHIYWIRFVDRVDRFVTLPGSLSEILFLALAILISIVVLKRLEEPWRERLRAKPKPPSPQPSDVHQEPAYADR